ncbi:lipopolysaccharide biosynthesis protein [Seminibacterium arietis]|uniref:Lipopolysaccharide biosynthesis protein n=1 Tax=Seminibacterium arietis TaxID=1173502 RepID=A0ABW3I7D9_9PAST
MNCNKNLISLIVITLLNMGLTIVSSFLLAHLLQVDERGEFQLFITSITYVATISVGGIGFTFTLCMRNKMYDHWHYYFYFFVTGSIFVAVLSLYFFSITEWTYLFIINVISTSILTITLEKSKIDSNLKIYRILSIQQPILAVLIYGIYYLLYGEQNVKNVLDLLTIIALIQVLSCIYFLSKINKDFKIKHDIRKIELAFFVKTWLKQNLLQVFGATTVNLDKFLIVSLMGNYFLGLYTVCLTFDALLTKILNMLADYYYSGLLNNINRIKIILAIVLLIIISGLVIIPNLSEYIVRLFFGPKYIEVCSTLFWFMFNSILAGLSWILSQNMLILGKQILLFTRQVISILVLVILFYSFKDLGLYGISYALIGASSVRLIISIFYYYKYPILKNCNETIIRDIK